jgi:SAM-dependent methyltransferase
LSRNGFDSLNDFGVFIRRFDTVLDAGCGNGRVLSLMTELCRADQAFVGIDFSAHEIARENLRAAENVRIFEGDLTSLSSFKNICTPDFIYCQEVLHHTSDPKLAFKNLAHILSPNGEIAIYVYKEKAPIREFTDDYVREYLSNKSVEEAFELSRQFADLGRVLSQLDFTLDFPEVKALGIPAGQYGIQRFLYHFFVKCYWNQSLTEDDNMMVNFDWYRPAHCSRHTEPEVLRWFEENNLEVLHLHVDEYGITARGRKNG